MLEESSHQYLMRLGTRNYDSVQQKLTDASGNNIKLRPQSARVLAILAARPKEVISKNDLIAAVWPDVSVTDDSLTQCIADIRKALDDRGHNVLRTAPKHGYVLWDIVDPVVTPEISPQEGLMDTNVRSLLGGVPQHTVLYILGSGRLLNTAKLRDVIGSITTLHPPIRSQQLEAHVALLTFETPIEAVRYAQALMRHGPGLSLDSLRMGIDILSRQSESTLAQLVDCLAANHIAATVDIRDQLYGSLECDFEDLGDFGGQGTTKCVRAYRVHNYEKSRLFVSQIDADEVLPTIAVLPLLQGNEGVEFNVLGNILADDIICTLSQAADFNVTSRLSTVGIQSKNTPLTEIATALNADFILSGNSFKESDNLIVTLEFIDTRSGKVLWAERKIHPVADWINDSGIVEGIANQIRKTIALNEVMRARFYPLHSLKNFTLLISAISLMHRLSWSDFQTARAMLDEIADRVPDHPVVLSWMARWYVLLVQQGWTDAPDRDGHTALQYSSRALEVDPECALALVSEGAVLINLFRDLDRAEERYNAALEINPNDANGRLLRGTLYAFKGDGKLAVKDSERAMNLAPLDPHKFMFLALSAGASLAAEDWGRAIELSNASLRLNRAHASTLRIKSVAQMRFGLEAAARETANDLLKVQPGLTVSSWLETSPSGQFEIGRKFAATLREIGVPD